MNKQVVKAGMVFGIAGILFWLCKPRSDRKPKTSKESSPEKLKNEARIVAIAYGKAMKDGLGPSELEELNQASEKKYGMRVYRKHSDGKWWVMDTKGNDILKIT